MKSRSNNAPIDFRSTSEHVSTAHNAPVLRRPERAEYGARPLAETFKPTTCHRCHHIVLAGIAEALPIRLDPNPLNQPAEVAALIAGRMTWQMNRRREVWWRSSSKIAAHPAGDHLEYAVFADHDCDFPISPTLTTWRWDKPAAAAASKEPAF
jgi:hypothetical protein